MVICKYYRQGNCRYGQYCQFEHINHFGNAKNEDDIVILVAKEVLLAERGGQWLLSCFAPLKERPCIPGMEDLSPEEVRWEMYHAQKNGIVEQAKLHFQQLCQDMKAKREMLKNPPRETITMLKKLLGSVQKGGLNASDNTAGKSSTLPFAAPQLSLVNNTSTNNVFGQHSSTTFGVQNNNPFGGGGFAPSGNASMFGKFNNNPAFLFGNAATFGNNLGGFGTATSGAGSIFGTTSTSTSFSGAQNSAPTFGTPQNNSIFGATSQNVFGQNNNVFGGTAQLGNASTTSLFNSPITSQANTSLFCGATTTASSLFGSSSTGLQTNPVFGVPTTSPSDSFNGGIFTQPKTQIPAFGGAPVFAGVTPNYANNSAGSSLFGGGQAFGAPAIPTSGIFSGSTVAATPAFGGAAATTTPAFGGAAATTTPGFGTSVATTTPGFGASATTAPPFDLSQQPANNTTFGTTVSAPNVFGAQNTDTMSFGAPSAAISSPFVTTSSQQFDSTSASSAPFAGPGFGVAVASTNNTFGTTETSSNSIFANAATTFATSNGTVQNSSLFPVSTFGSLNTSSPFGSTAGSTTITATAANPFAPRMQQGSSPFGNIAQNQSNINASPFGKSPFGTTAISTVIDDTIYSADSALTDDEKNMFLAEKFIIGKIPLKPPTKDIR